MIMSSNEKKTIPLRENFWTTPSEDGGKAILIGSRCTACGEIFFPKKEKNWCVHCNTTNLEDITLSRTGKIATFSVVMQQPGGGFYKGPVPYAYGCVDLEEGVRIETHFSTDDFEKLKVGLDVELVIEKLCEDEEGNDVLTFKFKPLS